MKKVEKVASGANFAAVTVGKTEELNQYALPLAPGVEIPGKVFVGGDLQATGAEMSFQQFAPGGSVGFLHTHKTHEELYIILGGDGEFQVDGQLPRLCVLLPRHFAFGWRWLPAGVRCATRATAR